MPRQDDKEQRDGKVTQPGKDVKVRGSCTRPPPSNSNNYLCYSTIYTLSDNVFLDLLMNTLEILGTVLFAGEVGEAALREFQFCAILPVQFSQILCLLHVFRRSPGRYGN